MDKKATIGVGHRMELYKNQFITGLDDWQELQKTSAIAMRDSRPARKCGGRSEIYQVAEGDGRKVYLGNPMFLKTPFSSNTGPSLNIDDLSLTQSVVASGDSP